MTRGTWCHAFAGRRLDAVLLLTLGLLMGALMGADATRVPMGYDECITAREAGTTWVALGCDMALNHENHPPLYFMVMHAWTTVAGSGPAALRAISIGFWALAVGGMYVLQRHLWESDAAPVLGAALLAFSPCVLWHSWNARPYELAVALEVWAAVFYVRTFFAERVRPRDYLLFVLAVLGGLTTEYHFVVPAGMMLLAALAGPQRRLAVGSAIGLLGAFALLSSPLLNGGLPAWVPLCTWITPLTTLRLLFTSWAWKVLLLAGLFGLSRPLRSRVPGGPLLLAALGVWLIPPLVGSFLPLFWPPRQGILLAPWVMSLLSGLIAPRLGKAGVALLVAVVWAASVVLFVGPLLLGPMRAVSQALSDGRDLERPGDILLLDGVASVTEQYYVAHMGYPLRCVRYSDLASALQQKKPHHVFWIGEPDSPARRWLLSHWHRRRVRQYTAYPIPPPDRYDWFTLMEAYEP